MPIHESFILQNNTQHENIQFRDIKQISYLKKKIITKCLWFPFFTLLNGLYPFYSISFTILHVCKNVQLNIRELSKIIKKVFAVSFCYLRVRCPFITEYRSVYHFCILHRRGFNVETNAFYISNRIHYVSY